MESKQAVTRVENIERALFDSRQVVAIKDKKIAQLEAQIMRASGRDPRDGVAEQGRDMVSLEVPSRSPTEDMPSMKIEPLLHSGTTYRGRVPLDRQTAQPVFVDPNAENLESNSPGGGIKDPAAGELVLE